MTKHDTRKRIPIPKDIQPGDVLVLRDGQRRKWETWDDEGNSVCEGGLPGGHYPNGSWWIPETMPLWDVVAVERKAKPNEGEAMSDNDQAAAILAGIMSTFGECAELHPEKQLPMATFILDAIRAGRVPTIYHISQIPGVREFEVRHDRDRKVIDGLRAEVEREKYRADKMKADGERAVVEERNETAKATAERDRLAGLLAESRRRLQGFYRNPPAMPIARDLLNRIDAALAEVRP